MLTQGPWRYYYHSWIFFLIKLMEEWKPPKVTGQRMLSGPSMIPLGFSGMNGIGEENSESDFCYPWNKIQREIFVLRERQAGPARMGTAAWTSVLYVSSHLLWLPSFCLERGHRWRSMPGKLWSLGHYLDSWLCQG